MKIYKQALKEVALFWLLVFSIFGYTGLTVYLTVVINGYFFLPCLLLPLFLGLSYIIYTESDSYKQERDKENEEESK